jgi:hypothetical protein
VFIPLPYIFNVKNSVCLINDLHDIPFEKDLKFVSFGITNMYTNIPPQELVEIIKIMCKQNDLNKITYNEIVKICDIIITQNYFRYNNSQYVQEQGLAMGAPTSSIFSEIYLQYLKNTKIFIILKNYHLIGYFRCVDDILLVYKNGLTNFHEILNLFNKLSPTMTFTMEKEINNSINFIGITVHKTDHNISFNIYRKPTATDIIIPIDSWHPPEHRMAAVRYLANLMLTYPMNDTNKKKEYNTIKQILHNNKYDAKILDKIILTINTRTNEERKCKHTNKT